MGPRMVVTIVMLYLWELKYLVSTIQCELSENQQPIPGYVRVHAPFPSVIATETASSWPLTEWCEKYVNYFVHRKCTAAAARNLSVQILYSMGNIWRIFVKLYLTFQGNWSTFVFFFSIWKASYWYTICRYVMLKTKVIKGKRLLSWVWT